MKLARKPSIIVHKDNKPCMHSFLQICIILDFNKWKRNFSERWRVIKLNMSVIQGTVSHVGAKISWKQGVWHKSEFGHLKMLTQKF